MNKIDSFLNKVIEGDCLEVMRNFPDECIDLILGNPDYSNAANEGDITIDLPALWQQYKRIIKPTGAVVLVASSPLTAKLVLSNPDWLNYKIVWIKSRASDCVYTETHPLKKAQDICIYYNKRPCCPQMASVNTTSSRHVSDNGGRYRTATAAVNGHRYPYDIFGYNEDIFDWFYCLTVQSEAEDQFYPTQNLVDLGRFMVKTFTLPKQIVLDSASGSGSFLIAAAMENRQYIGITKHR